MEWRDDGYNEEESPTAGCTVVVASDVVKSSDDVILRVDHVKSFPHGNGFKPIVHGIGHTTIGNVYIGVGDDVYQRAVKEGLTILEDHLKRNK